MANIQLTVPDAAIARIRDAFCAEFNYQATLEDGTPNPQNKTEFTRQQIIAYVRQVVKNNESNKQAGLARKAVEAEIDAISIT